MLYKKVRVQNSICLTFQIKTIHTFTILFSFRRLWMGSNYLLPLCNIAICNSVFLQVWFHDLFSTNAKQNKHQSITFQIVFEQNSTLHNVRRLNALSLIISMWNNENIHLKVSFMKEHIYLKRKKGVSDSTNWKVLPQTPWRGT